VAYLVQTMDRLRAPGGCPWDMAQTHQTLVRHLLEEAFEAAEAIEDGDRAALLEELGDVLLQVVFHAAIAAGEPDPFDLDDVARAVADKLIRRHPHIFEGAGPDPAMTAEESHRRWDQMKAAEKARGSVLDGIPVAQPALARAQKVVARAERGGVVPAQPADTASLGGQLLALVKAAQQAGLDAESELRLATRQLEKDIRAVESQRKEAGCE